MARPPLRILCAALGLLVLAPLGASPDAPIDEDAARRARIEGAAPEALASLAGELKTRPGILERLFEDMRAWQEAGRLPQDPFLQEIDRVHLRTPIAKASRLVELLTEVPASLVDPSARPGEALLDGQWEGFWTSNGKPGLPWRPALLEKARADLKSPERIQAALHILAFLRDPLAQEKAVELLKSSKDDNLRAAACRALALLEDPRSEKPLLEIVKTDAEDRKAEGRTGTKRPRNVLPVRAAAAVALLRIGKPGGIPPALLESPAFKAALKAEGSGPVDLSGIAEEELLSGDPERAFPARLLAHQPADALAAQLARLQASHPGGKALYCAAARLLLGDESQRAVLEKALDGKDRTLRTAAVSYLLETGGEEGVAKVNARLGSLVDEAIDAGAAALRGLDPALESGGKPDAKLDAGTYGYTALKLLALLKSGVKPEELPKEMEVLMKGPQDRSACFVYNLSLSLLCLEALEKKAPRAKAQQFVTLLCHEMLPEGAWNYGAGLSAGLGGSRWDHSNTQFALLGLRAGALLGVDIPDSIWRKCLAHWQETFVKEGDYAGGWIYGPADALLPRGAGPLEKPYASMTCAGICSLLLCQHYLGQEKRDPRVDLGLAWLDKHFYIYGGEDASQMNPYYYLYSIERTGVIAGVKAFGKRDWYREGALALLRAQKPDGSWSSLEATSFALLFLTRATNPLKYEIGAPKPEPEILKPGYEVGGEKK